MRMQFGYIYLFDVFVSFDFVCGIDLFICKQDLNMYCIYYVVFIIFVKLVYFNEDKFGIEGIF